MSGMTLDEAKEVLGDPDWTKIYPQGIVFSYEIGSIEGNSLGQILTGVRKQDDLWIYFDHESKIITKLKTSS